jgi:hypothetical protein
MKPIDKTFKQAAAAHETASGRYYLVKKTGTESEIETARLALEDASCELHRITYRY